MRILPLAEAKAKLSGLVAAVVEDDEEITITRNGRAAAVIVSYDQFERWHETEVITGDAELMRELRKGISDLKHRRGRVLTEQELDRLFAPPRPRRKPR